MSPLPIAEIPDSFCKGLSIFFTDLDGTIAVDGLITASSYQSLWALYQHGIEVVVVTGRPAGWCDHIARMWPVAGVIGENGAFSFSYDRVKKRMKRRYLISELQRLEGRKKLDRIRERVLKEVPACRIASDQDFRITDLAIDYSEDAGPLGEEELGRICRVIAEEGASYKISSIHVNCWYGDFNKRSGVREFLKHERNQALRELADRIVFIGDSPNDEPLFEALKYSIAVANISPFLEKLTSRPLYITRQQAAAGFCEAVDTILSKRKRIDS